MLPGEKWSGQNRISHPHWVKICDDHNGQINLRTKQKYEVLSATLFKKDFKWNWLVDCQKALVNLKTVLTSDLTLTHYDTNKEIYVASNARNLDLRALLLHKEKDGQLKGVYHASRISRIEKEG